MIKNRQKNKGFVALLTIILVSAAVLIMAFSSSILGLGSLEGGVTQTGSSRAFWMADTCIDEALERLRESASYAGGNESNTNASCIISVTPSGDERLISVTASTTDGYYAEIESQVDLSQGFVVINSWERI